MRTPSPLTPMARLAASCVTVVVSVILAVLALVDASLSAGLGVAYLAGIVTLIALTWRSP